MAQIKLTITADTQGVQKSVEQIKNQFTALSQQLSKLTVNKDLTAQIDSLSRYYETLATAASKTRNSATKTTAQVDTLRKSYANLARQIKTLKGQSAGEAFDDINKQVEANLKSVQALSEAYKKGNWGDEEAKELKTLSDGYKSLAADVSEVRLANEKASVTEPFSPKLIDSIYRVQSRFESLKTTISGIEKYYPKGTFAGITAEIDKNVASLKALEVEYQTTGKLSQQSVDKFNEISRAVLEQDAAFKQTRNSATNYHGSIRDIIAGFAKFQLSAMLVMKPLQMMQNALSSINETLVETEDAVISISRVLDENISNGEIADEIYRIAQSLGQTFDVVQEIAQNFAKAGLDWQDTLKATEAAVLALNVAELDAAEASEGLIAIMQQFGYEAEDLTYIIDVLNKTADKSAVDTQELLVALQKTGSYAKESNLTLEQTVALITAISEATAASGQNIGNALKSLFAYSSKDSALDVFAALSPDMDAVVGEYRKGAASILDVWRQLSNEINSLSAEQGKLLDQYFTSEEGSALEEALGGDLAEIQDSIKGVYDSAGVYRKNYFIALLSNMEEVDNVLGDLSNVAGYTMTEQEKYMETYTAKVNALKSQWQALVNDEQGILGLKKLLVDVGSGILTVIEWTGGLRTTFIALGTIIAFVFGEKIYNGLKSFAAGIKNITSGFNAAATAAQKFQAAMGWIGLAMTVVSALVGVIQRAIEAQEEARQATIDNWNAEKDRAASLAKLYNQLKELESISEKSEEQEKEYLSTQESIIGLLGDRANILETLKEGTDEYREALEKLTKEEIKRQAQNAKAALAALGDEPKIDGQAESLRFSYVGSTTLDKKLEQDEIRDALKEAGFEEDVHYQQGFTGLTTGNIVYIELQGENDYQTLENINNAIDALYYKGLTDNSYYQELVGYREKYETAIQEYLETFASAEAWDELLQNGTPETEQEVDNIVNSIMGATGATETWRDEIESIVVSIVGIKKEVDDTKGDIDDTAKTLEKLSEEMRDGLAEYLQGLRDAPDEAEKIQKLVDAIADAEENLAKVREEAAEKIKEAEEEVIEAQRDVNDEMVELLENQEKAIDALKDAEERLQEAASNINDERLALQDELKNAEEDLASIREEAEEKALELDEKRLAIQEKQLAVEEAKKALEDAREARTVRRYNRETGQLEWQADEGAIKEAEDAVKSAQDELASAEEDYQQAQEDYQELLDEVKAAEDNLSLIQATIADAEQAIADAIAAGYDISKEIWEEEKGIATGVRDAIEQYIEAQKAVDEAQEEVDNYAQAVKDAQEAITNAFNEGLLETQEITKTTQSLAQNVYDAIEAVKDANQGVIDAQQEANEDIAAAEEKLQEAVDALNDYFEDKAWEGVIEEIKSGNATNASIKELLGNVRDQAFDNHATDVSWYQAIIDAIKEYAGVDITIEEPSDEEGKPSSDSDNSGGGKPSGAIGGGGGKFAQSQLYYDSGGVAKGRGLFAKDTDRHESIINDPDLTEKILSPVPSKQFDRYVRDMGILFEHARVYEQSPVMRSVVGNTDNSIDNSRQVIIKDVNVGAQKRDSLVDALGLAALVD